MDDSTLQTPRLHQVGKLVNFFYNKVIEFKLIKNTISGYWREFEGKDSKTVGLETDERRQTLQQRLVTGNECGSRFRHEEPCKRFTHAEPRHFSLQDRIEDYAREWKPYRKHFGMCSGGLTELAFNSLFTGSQCRPGEARQLR